MKTDVEKTDNELIAEFMGHDVPKEYLNGSDRNNKYDTSWDWLMPVVEKIEALGYETEIRWDSRNHPGEQVFVRIGEGYDSGLNFTTGVNQSKIEAVYRAVVEFIKWHRSLNP